MIDVDSSLVAFRSLGSRLRNAASRMGCEQVKVGGGTDKACRNIYNWNDAGDPNRGKPIRRFDYRIAPLAGGLRNEQDYKSFVRVGTIS